MAYNPGSYLLPLTLLFFAALRGSYFLFCEGLRHLEPKSVIRPTFIPFLAFLGSVYAISAFLSASCPHHCLAVARYVFASDAANLLETNTNLA